MKPEICPYLRPPLALSPERDRALAHAPTPCKATFLGRTVGCLSMSTPHLPASVVAITGAAGALGSEVARRLADEGYRLALIDTPRSSARLKALAADLGDACPIEGDIAEAA